MLAPAVCAGGLEEALDEQSRGFGMEELERAGEEYIGPARIGEDLDVGEVFGNLTQRGKAAMGGVVKTSVRSCVLLLAVTLLCGLVGTMKEGSDELKVTTLAGALSITVIAVGDVHSLLSMGEEAIFNMETIGDVLLPAVSMATAASGAPAAAAVKHGVTILFSDFLIRLIDGLLIPLCYAFIAANVAWAALGN